MSFGQLAVKAGHFLVDIDGGGVLLFQAMPPAGTGWTTSKSVNWRATGILGRSSPIQGYANSEPRTFSVPVYLHSSVEQFDPTTPEIVKLACDWLESLAYPDYKVGVRPPHRIFLHLGLQINTVCVLSRISIRYLDPKDPFTGLAYNAVCDCTFIEVEDVPSGVDDVRGLAGLLGVI
jgi:hypothetical protein